MNEDNLIPYNDTVVVNQKREPRKWDFFVIHPKKQTSENIDKNATRPPAEDQPVRLKLSKVQQLILKNGKRLAGI
ncbi:hypothetical protein KAR91_87170 [Candidatus Pacearchaeota archaeon]|nr:hypothetical protein [Candidatus Pacearchaeota archaeon]